MEWLYWQIIIKKFKIALVELKSLEYNFHLYNKSKIDWLNFQKKREIYIQFNQVRILVVSSTIISIDVGPVYNCFDHLSHVSSILLHHMDIERHIHKKK